MRFARRSPVPDRPRIILGVGSSSDIAIAELLELCERVLALGNVARPDTIATLLSKQGEAVWNDLAVHYGCGLMFFDAATLEAQTPRLKNPSQAIFRVVGCHGVAEAAALAGVGKNGFLRVEKTVSAHATAALAMVAEF